MSRKAANPRKKPLDPVERAVRAVLAGTKGTVIGGSPVRFPPHMPADEVHQRLTAAREVLDKHAAYREVELAQEVRAELAELDEVPLAAIRAAARGVLKRRRVHAELREIYNRALSEREIAAEI